MTKSKLTIEPLLDEPEIGPPEDDDFWTEDRLEEAYKEWVRDGRPEPSFGHQDFGNVNRIPMDDLLIHENRVINEMSMDELREALRKAQSGWMWTYSKMSFYAHYLKFKPEIITRDPGAPLIIGALMNEGLSDHEIAKEIGQKVRFVESVRLQLLRKTPEKKYKPGRPPKSTKPKLTPKAT